jgi:hypothetical protein
MCFGLKTVNVVERCTRHVPCLFQIVFCPRNNNKPPDVIMIKLSSDYTIRDVGGHVTDMLMVTRHNTTLLLVLAFTQNPPPQDCLNAFELDTWDCLPMCEVVSVVDKLYQVLDDIFMYGEGQLYQVTSVNPLAVTYHGQTEANYECIAVIDQHTLIGVDQHDEAYMLSPSGENVRKLRRNFTWGYPYGMVSRNGIIAVKLRTYQYNLILL